MLKIVRDKLVVSFLYDMRRNKVLTDLHLILIQNVCSQEKYPPLLLFEIWLSLLICFQDQDYSHHYVNSLYILSWAKFHTITIGAMYVRNSPLTWLDKLLKTFAMSNPFDFFYKILASDVGTL